MEISTTSQCSLGSRRATGPTSSAWPRAEGAPGGLVAAEALVGGHGALEVDAVAGADAGEAGLVERLLHHVGGPGVVGPLRDGEAAAVDGDRVAEAGVVEHGGGADGEADGVALVLDRGDGAELLDDSGEHQVS